MDLSSLTLEERTNLENNNCPFCKVELLKMKAKMSFIPWGVGTNTRAMVTVSRQCPVCKLLFT